MRHLETDITTACQLSCVACNHHVPLYRARGVQNATPRQLEHDLGILARLLHADRWGALGGEPLLHRDLVTLLEIARASGVADRIEVWTNGLRLRDMPAAFWSAFDDLVLSVYPGKHDAASLQWIAARCTEAGVRLVVNDERTRPNFRTLLEAVPTEPAATVAKFKACFFRWFSRVANFGFFFTCCCAPHMPVLIQGQPFGTDGIPITSELTEADIEAYLTRSEPLGACSLCAGRATAIPIPWREIRDPEQWVAASSGRIN